MYEQDKNDKSCTILTYQLVQVHMYCLLFLDLRIRSLALQGYNVHNKNNCAIQNGAKISAFHWLLRMLMERPWRRGFGQLFARDFTGGRSTEYLEYIASRNSWLVLDVWSSSSWCFSRPQSTCLYPHEQESGSPCPGMWDKYLSLNRVSSCRKWVRSPLVACVPWQSSETSDCHHCCSISAPAPTKCRLIAVMIV